MTAPLKILTYDIETVLMMFYAFAPGKQYLGHKQLVPGKSRYGIICITYCWNDDPVQILKWEPIGGQAKLIADFDALVKQADHVIGKNSARFDNKMINGLRIFTDLPGMPDWVRYTDDLEVQMRKYFRLPSQSLDYISHQMGLGGKVSMEMGDWIAIDQYMTSLTLIHDGMPETYVNLHCKHMYNKNIDLVLKDGKKAFDKMCKYGMKDTRDTRTLWNKLSKHFEPRLNLATFNGVKDACKVCASHSIIKNGTRVAGNVRYQCYYCSACGSYAGRHAMSQSGKARKLL